ncbi:hypothetical protein AB6A40_006856 [Gnathostoma spinigerum]|uniref:BLOC-1-related complex subunit 5 n=1 Tax=Gnathostoma spinigerum TaxID=75299 RepID=A0ABD6ETY2_9BILA
MTTSLKNMDSAISSLLKRLSDRQKRFERLLNELSKINELNSQITNIKFVLQDLIPSVETMNEILPESDRLPTLDFGRVLERTPVSSSDSSPEHPSSSHGRNESAGCKPIEPVDTYLIEPVEECHVIDEQSMSST